jgi:hypothetical protein
VSKLSDNASFEIWEIRSALEKILSDAEFQRNSSSARFLQFVVEETLAGRGDRLKGFTIATLALGRNTDFDPQSSSAVRVQATRLRHLLAEYYRGPGSQESVRVALPLGSYQPRFERHAEASPTSLAEHGTAPSRSWRGLRRAQAWRIAGIPIVACLAIASAALLLRSHPFADSAAENWSSSKTPVVVVESANDFNATKDAADVTQLAVAAIESELSVFDHFVVKQRADSNGGDKPDYILSIRAKLSASGGAIDDFTFHLVYLPTNEIVWSRTFPRISLGDPASIDGMTNAVVSEVGEQQMGAILADQLARVAIARPPLQGYACLLEAHAYLSIRNPMDRGPVRDCLERELSINARDDHALSLLAFILIRDYLDLPPNNKGLADIERAQELAQLAAEIAPYRSETAAILFRSRFYARRFDDAFAVAPQLLANLPNARLVSANVGVAYISRARYDEGMAILSRLEESNLGAPAFSVPTLALAAYMRGDEATAERFASRAVAAQQPMGLVMQIVVCERQNRQACVIEASRQLHQDYPGFAADVPAALFRYALADDIRVKLLVDLRAAGFFDETAR